MTIEQIAALTIEGELTEARKSLDVAGAIGTSQEVAAVRQAVEHIERAVRQLAITFAAHKHPTPTGPTFPPG